MRANYFASNLLGYPKIGKTDYFYSNSGAPNGVWEGAMQFGGKQLQDMNKEPSALGIQ